MDKSNEEHYVNNAEFLKALVDYKKSVREAKKRKEPKPRVTEYLGECILKIATGLSHRWNFSKYTYREEMVGYAVYNCLKDIHKFNAKKSKNAFGYFTTMVWRAFLRKMEDEEKNFYIRCKEYENALPDLVNSVNVSDDYHRFLLDTIADYEAKKAKRKQKQIERAQERAKEKENDSDSE